MDAHQEGEKDVMQMFYLKEIKDKEAIAKFKMNRQETKYVSALKINDIAPLGSDYNDVILEEKISILLNCLDSENVYSCSKDFF